LSYKKKKFKIKRKVKAFRFLMDNFDLNMKEAQRWIDKGRVLIKDQPLTKKSAYLVGEFEVIYFQTSTRNLLPIFETRDFALYDKPSGILIHPTNRFTDYSLTHEIKHRYGKDANITHRLDRETSGIVLVSKNKKSEKEIKNLFEQRLVKKTYLCYVKGNIKKNFIVDEPILKNRCFDEIKLKVQIDQNGKRAITDFKPLYYNPIKNTTLLQATPHTGRQHQIRVHLFHAGFPIIGDPIYGVDTQIADEYLNKRLSNEQRLKLTGANRLMLHAYSIEFFYKNRFKIVSKESFTF
jgi:23S rRNA pseudouridine1911/1915/1917 synthase